MKIILKKMTAPYKRRRELHEKILALLQEYDDVPIMIANKIIFQEDNGKAMFNFTCGEQKNQVHILIENIFQNTQTVLKLK